MRVCLCLCLYLNIYIFTYIDVCKRTYDKYDFIYINKVVAYGVALFALTLTPHSDVTFPTTVTPRPLTPHFPRTPHSSLMPHSNATFLEAAFPSDIL